MNDTSLTPAALIAFEDESCRWGYRSLTGEIVIEARFERAQPWVMGQFASVRSEGRYGYINRQGEWVIAPQYKDAQSFSDGIAAVKTNEGWHYINAQGERIHDGEYEYISHFVNGVGKLGTPTLGHRLFGWVADVEVSLNWIFIDRKGDRLDPDALPAEIRADGYGGMDPNAQYFDEDVLPVRTTDDLFGYKRAGDDGWLIEPRFRYNVEFRCGVAINYAEDVAYMLSREGKVLATWRACPDR